MFNMYAFHWTFLCQKHANTVVSFTAAYTGHLNLFMLPIISSHTVVMKHQNHK